MKKPLLLLHGALGSQTQFQSLLPLLEADYDLFHFNFDGHGGVESTAPYTMALFVENTLNFLDQNGLAQVDVFGYSMGGYVALNLALQNPERLGRILTLGTKFAWTPESAAREVKMLNPQKIAEKVPAFAQQLAQLHAPLAWEGVVEKTAQMMLAMGEGQRLSMEDLGQIKQEVLIGLGSEDRMVTLEESEKAAEALTQGRLLSLAGQPHPIEKVDFSVLAHSIKNFFT